MPFKHIDVILAEGVVDEDHALDSKEPSLEGCCVHSQFGQDNVLKDFGRILLGFFFLFFLLLPLIRLLIDDFFLDFLFLFLALLFLDDSLSSFEERVFEEVQNQRDDFLAGDCVALHQFFKFKFAEMHQASLVFGVRVA